MFSSVSSLDTQTGLVAGHLVDLVYSHEAKRDFTSSAVCSTTISNGSSVQLCASLCSSVQLCASQSGLDFTMLRSVQSKAYDNKDSIDKGSVQRCPLPLSNGTRLYAYKANDSKVQ
ncbi:hypothetical protein BgiBS90_031140 [Biomphalaria glabrata]|nr:hypothetical protein BgiBS90_031140 [Biomphalaria glabrata]